MRNKKNLLVGTTYHYGMYSGREWPIKQLQNSQAPFNHRDVHAAIFVDMK
jgi:hypothetical protein